MELRSGVQRVARLDLEAAQRVAARPGTRVYALPELGIVDRVTFFAAVRAVLPLEPPIENARSWDALSDSLFEGLHVEPCDRVVILWPRSHVMATRHPDDFEIACGVFEQVATLLADPSATLQRPKEVCVVIG